MARLTARLSKAIILGNDNPKGPWGSGGGNGGNGGNGGGNGGDGGPRNPWAFPPGGRRPRPNATSLDEFLKRARRGGGGFPGGFGSKQPWIYAAIGLVLIWLIFTSVHSIGPQQRGVVTYFGRYTGTLNPGIRLTAPVPVANVQKVDVEQIRTEQFPEGTQQNLMLTGDQNIIDIKYQVRWDIRDPESYVFQIANPEETVRDTAESAMREVMATVTLEQAIGAGRTAIEARVQNRMQELLDDYNSGVRVQGVAIEQADPPDAVNEEFKAVTAAQQQAQADLNDARAYAQQIIARAQGEAAEFDKIYEQYALAPEVTRRRLYYETMEQVLARSNKTIIEAPGVTPYLPLPEVRRRSRAEPAPVPAPGGGQ